MRILIRKLIQTSRGGQEFQDLEVQADLLSVGRASDQLLYLPGTKVALRHAVFSSRGDTFSVAANGGTTLSVNGKDENSATLKVGDIVTIAGHALKVIRPPAGFNFALEVHEAASEEKQGVAGQSGYETDLNKQGVSKRVVAWISVLLVLVFGLGLPLLDASSPEMHKKLSDAGFPAANFWSSGPLANVHHNSKAVFDCHSCHATPFAPVANDQCIDCHKHTGNHAHQDNAAFTALSEQACGECHEEHNEPEKLVRVDQGLCVDCHGDIKAVDPQSPLENVEDFSETQHPSFKVTTHALKNHTSKDGEWQTLRVKLADLTKETSNLKFNHKVHLNPEGISTPLGTEVMECDDCHQLDESGWYMKPMTMETTCRTCHALTFDEDNPERQVPHGEPDAVMTSLQEYFLRKYTEPAQAQQAQSDKELRRGRPGHEREKAFECTGDPRECARTMTQRTLTELFERTACFTCHQVEKQVTTGGFAEYSVVPVKITSQWMTGAKFSHADHMTEGCDKCHAAEKSEHSEEVMIPDIDNCQECHGGNSSWGKLNSTCIECHDFHFDDRGFMGAKFLVSPATEPHENNTP